MEESEVESDEDGYNGDKGTRCAAGTEEDKRWKNIWNRRYPSRAVQSA